VCELLNLLAEFDQKGVGFKSLGDPWCETTAAHGWLMLTVLGGLAEFERSLIIARTSEGLERKRTASASAGLRSAPTSKPRLCGRPQNGETASLIGRSYLVRQKRSCA
jgi:DNA invertase Pin-like site-specific DNA recombinase